MQCESDSIDMKIAYIGCIAQSVGETVENTWKRDIAKEILESRHRVQKLEQEGSNSIEQRLSGQWSALWELKRLNK